MTKSELIRVVSVKNEIPIDQAEILVNTFFDVLSGGLQDGRRVELRGFGTFSVREYDGYMGRNPKTGEAVAVAPKRLPCFKTGKGIKKAVDSGN